MIPTNIAPSLMPLVSSHVFNGTHGAGRRVGTVRNADFAASRFLVGFAAADGDLEAVGREDNVRAIEGHELAATKGAGEAEEKKSAIAQAEERVA